MFSSEDTYLPVLQDASYVVSIIEQILHYMVQNGELVVSELRGRCCEQLAVARHFSGQVGPGTFQAGTASLWLGWDLVGHRFQHLSPSLPTSEFGDASNL